MVTQASAQSPLQKLIFVSLTVGDLAFKPPRIHVKRGFFDNVENKLSSNFERKLTNSSVDWEGDL